MKSLALKCTLVAICLSMAASCNDNEFAGSSGGKASSDGEDPNGEPKDPDDPPPSENGNPECVEGDKVNFQWSGPVKECLIDQGKTYNFEQDKCTEMRKAEFECTWENVKGEMDKLGLSSSVLNTDSAAGAKLVSCGQSEDKNRIVIQWVKVPDGGVDCKNFSAKSMIVTGCYTLWVGKPQPPDPKNDEERKKQVYECMNEL